MMLIEVKRRWNITEKPLAAVYAFCKRYDWKIHRAYLEEQNGHSVAMMDLWRVK